MVDFAELKNTRVGDVEKPKPVAKGHWQAMFAGPATAHNAKSGNLALRFPVKLVAPLDDVDQEELAASGGIPDKTFNVDFWMSPDARYRFTEFGKAMGHSEDLSITDLAEALATSGTAFQVEVRHEPNERDPEMPFSRIDNLQPLAA